MLIYIIRRNNMKLYYNKDRDKTVALSEDAEASALANLRVRGYKYICTVYHLCKDVIDLGSGVNKEARRWFNEEPLTLEQKVKSLELSVRRLERLADENGWNDYRRKSVK